MLRCYPPYTLYFVSCHLPCSAISSPAAACAGARQVHATQGWVRCPGRVCFVQTGPCINNSFLLSNLSIMCQRLPSVNTLVQGAVYKSGVSRRQRSGLQIGSIGGALGRLGFSEFLLQVRFGITGVRRSLHQSGSVSGHFRAGCDTSWVLKGGQ